MRSCVLLCVLLLLLPGVPAKKARKIQVGKFTFLVESVLKLKEVLHGEGEDLNNAASEACDNPNLPEEFHVVCVEDDASDIFVKLAAVDDECEICANPACPGCW
ncbi:guanylin-like isoform X2 [Dendropsophus ebraccatus]|uniref:guanylin-like isoform X2 n=1 Tax=Dendropsophus ebraccatus TaxID=150705 RepID=UPI0038319040